MSHAFIRRTPALLAAGAALALAATGLALPPAAAVGSPIQYPGTGTVQLNPLGTYATAEFDESAAEIVAFHAATERAFVVNARSGAVDVLDISSPSAPTKVSTLEVAGVSAADGSHIPSEGAVVNSVAIRPDGLGAAAVESDTKTDNGWVVFFDARAEEEPVILGAVRVGALPDMLTFTPEGRYVVVANEGEPDGEQEINGQTTYETDPEGSISIIDVPSKLAAPKQNKVRTADFHRYDTGVQALPEGVRVFGPADDHLQYPISANLEPEYVTVSADGRTAYVTLQENNAIAVVNVRSAQVRDILPLGTQDWSQTSVDVSNEDGAINLANWPVKSFYLPDAIASYQADGQTYLVTANEGDARDWDAFSEEARVKDLGDPDEDLAPLCLDGYTGDLDELQKDESLGRLNITTTAGYDAAKGCFSELYGFGGRSFSIWTADGEQVFDSGSQFEEITAEALPQWFNSNNDDNDSFDARSDDKGPEPEAVTIGEVDGRTYAFVGLERVGGIMVYDITDPAEASFVTYVNNRDFTVEDVESAEAGDLGPEGMAFVPAADSPTGTPLLLVANEVSGTTTAFGITTQG